MSEVPANSTWHPISRDDLLSLIATGESAMAPDLLAFWGQIRLDPVKWSLPPWGDQGGGFWVVGIIGQQVVWYNDIEDGFNRGCFERFGRIKDYWCDQLELDQCVHWVFAEFHGEKRQPHRAGPPEPISENRISD